MTRVLIVHAHPEPQSFTTSLQNAAAEELRKQSHEVVVTDLYALGFNPVASSEDFSDRRNPDYLTYALEQRHAYGNGTLAPDVKPHVDLVLWAELVIFTFPIFWFSTPAILKGWIDRVLLSGPFYGGLRFYDKGGMRGKKAWVVATLGGQPHMFGAESVHGDLSGLLSHFLRGTLGYVGFDVLKPFFAYHVPYITQDQRVELLESFRQELRSLNTRPTMDFPSLSDFSEKLYPLTREGASSAHIAQERTETLKEQNRNGDERLVLLDGMVGATIALSHNEMKDFYRGGGLVASIGLVFSLFVLWLYL
ncbi:NAD(P)H-dependent oxidoreductase [Cupriavidus sp. 2SB]|uniref:NAD(P)H-dependent oxidoreductase n=1 Tax=Cupriavidus sp. 2SB TaxID=2502199 RepID=UPI0010F76CA3